MLADINMFFEKRWLLPLNLVAKEANGIQGFINRNIASKSREVIPSLYLSLVRQHLDCKGAGVHICFRYTPLLVMC